MGGIWDKIKSHPWVTGAIIGVVLLVLFYSGSSSSSATTTTAATDPNADAVTVAQLQAQQAVQQSADSLTANAQNIQGSIDLSNIQASTVNLQSQLEAEVALSQIGAQQETTDTANTLSAQVEENNNATQLGIANVEANSSLQQTSLLTSALVTNASTAAGVEESLIGANASVQSQAIQAQASTAQQSWVSKIFG